jgi:large subunit ribosomal protein L21
MVAVVQTSGHQFSVKQGDQIVVDRLEANEGDTIVFDQVLMLMGGAAPKIGTPLVKGAKVTAKVVEHGKGERLITFKYRRRQRMRRRVGFRAHNTTLEITGIEG